MKRTGFAQFQFSVSAAPALQTILLSQISFKGVHLLLSRSAPPRLHAPAPPAPQPTVIITHYHGDAQTPDVGLHAVSLLVELWVYSLGLERRRKKTTEMTFLAQ